MEGGGWDFLRDEHQPPPRGAEKWSTPRRSARVDFIARRDVFIQEFAIPRAANYIAHFLYLSFVELWARFVWSFLELIARDSADDRALNNFVGKWARRNTLSSCEIFYLFVICTEFNERSAWITRNDEMKIALCRIGSSCTKWQIVSSNSISRVLSESNENWKDRQIHEVQF